MTNVNRLDVRTMAALLVSTGISLALPATAADVQKKDAKAPAATKEAVNPQSQKYKDAFWKGEILRRSGKFENAIASYDECLKLSPNDAAALSARGFCYAKLNEFDHAIKDFDDSLKQKPDHLTWYLRGITHSIMHKEDKAVEDFTHCLMISPQAFSAVQARAVSYAKLGQYQKAIADDEFLLKSMPAKLPVLVNLGNCYNKVNKPAKALEIFNRAVEMNNMSGDAFKGRGDAYAQSGDNDKALADYTKAISLNDGDTASMYDARAKVYTKTGKKDLAASDMQKVKDLASGKK